MHPSPAPACPGIDEAYAEPFRLLARLYNANEFNDLQWIGKTMSGKYEVSGTLHSVLRKQHDAGRKPPVSVMQQDLAVLEPESRGYDPYNKAPPPPAN